MLIVKVHCQCLPLINDRRAIERENERGTERERGREEKERKGEQSRAEEVIVLC